ncbi:hypothetical protein B0H19DRAFT_1146788 [Mycena capillaripes]|nr:hypothetical protein B0H19DRAFT_1146788 [Mycena capillaripes]
MLEGGEAGNGNGKGKGASGMGMGGAVGVLQLTALGESLECVEVPLAALGGYLQNQNQPGVYGAGGNGNGNGKGKGKAPAEDVFSAPTNANAHPGVPAPIPIPLPIGPVRVEEDAGGETGFLCVGGHWDDPHAAAAFSYSRPELQRSVSGVSVASVDEEEVVARWMAGEGVYGWCRKGVADWRVFWVGGSGAMDDEGEWEEGD